MASESLHLNILRHGNTLAMYFMERGPVAARSEVQVDESLLTHIGEDLGRLTNLANTRVGLRSAEAPALPSTLHDLQTAFQNLGELIFRRLFPDTIRQKLRHTPVRDLVLHLHDRLVHVPWELAFDGEDFLLAKFRIGRQVLADDRLTQGRTARQRSAPLRMLIIADPTESLLAAAEEAEQLCALFDAYDNVEVDVMGGKQIRKIDLLQALGAYDLVHYAGHALFDPARPERSGWVLHDNAVLTAAELREVESPPLLVFSNACQAGIMAPWQVEHANCEQAYEKAAFGIGSAFLLAGVQNYIGTFCVIHDRSSAAFAADFYRHFLSGACIGEALATARQRTRQEQARSGLLWASYMHYGDPTFRLAAATASASPPPVSDVPAAPLPDQDQSGLAPPGPSQPLPPRWRKPPLMIAGGLLGFLGLLGVLWLWQIWPFPAPPDPWLSPPLTVAYLPCTGEPLEHRIAPILHASGRVTLVEREHLDKLITELQIDPRYIDRATGLRLGKILAARLIAFCEFSTRADGRWLSVRLAETETTVVTVAATEAVETPEALESVIQQLASDLLRQIRQTYQIQGRIADVTPQGILLSIGTDRGVTVGLTLDVFGTAEPLLVERPIGQLLVTEVAPKYARAKILRVDVAPQDGWRVKEVQQQ